MFILRKWGKFRRKMYTTMFRRLRFVVLSFMISAVSFSASLSFQNLNRVKVDDLSDVEISQFVKKYTGAGYTLADVERMAQSKNMPSTELEKLKVRISALEASASSVLADEKISTEMTGVKSDETNVGVGNSSKKNSRVYGMSVFNNSKISFEPSQSVATPRNYRLGANDVLHVDVYGMAEATYDWTVSKDGNIRIPNVGVVFVDGMTLEQAENVIKKKLSTLYNSINSGRTSVAVSINHIRSIKVYILGEVENPGSYTLSSVSSVFNAMNACGGPSENGSMRNVQLIRNGRSIAKVDLYEFLQKGAMPSDMTLQDQDVIQVPPYENRVTVNGAAVTALPAGTYENVSIVF